MNPPIRLYMSMSLDGFITGPDDRPGQELGRDGGRLFNWMDDRMSDGPNGQDWLLLGLLHEYTSFNVKPSCDTMKLMEFQGARPLF